MTYGLPAGTQIPYGAQGFPQWVYDLADVFGLQASTYPGHQEGQRAEKGFAPNPQGLNRGIDWTGPTPNMQRFADYLLTVKSQLEQVIWLNPVTGRRVGVAGGEDVSQSAYYEADYGGHTDHVHTRQSQSITLPNGVVMQHIPPRPKFAEAEAWIGNSSPRNGVNPDLFILHTQEGGDGDPAALARWMGGNGVSYHYTISTGREQVTVCDVIDTDLASWSVLSANPRSINLCFAGSKASWSRAQWLANKDAIDVAAYLAVQDCRKYNIPLKVIAPPYSSGRAGVTDHNYVTTMLGDGSHTDCGPNFPWDVFTASFNLYAGNVESSSAPSTYGGFLMALSDAEQKELLDLARQQSGVMRVSRSPLRHLGEGPTQTVTGFEWSTDGSVHVLVVEALACLGHPPTLQLLAEIANADPARFPDRQEDAKLAQAILNKVAAQLEPVPQKVIVSNYQGDEIRKVDPTPATTTSSNAIHVEQQQDSGDHDLYAEMTVLRNQIHSLIEALADLSTAFLGKRGD